jgi:hypothetical protein
VKTPAPGGTLGRFQNINRSSNEAFVAAITTIACELLHTTCDLSTPRRLNCRAPCRLPINSFGSTLSPGAQTPLREKAMKETGLDHRHRDKDGAISKKHGNTLVGTLRKIYGKGFAAGYPDTTELSEVLHQLNETSLSQLRRDHDTGHLGHKIDHVPK